MKITNEHLADKTDEELNELSKKIEEIKKKRAKTDPAKKLFEEDEKKMRKKYEELIKKYHKIEVTAQLPAIKISYSLDVMRNWFDELFNTPVDDLLDDFAKDCYSYENDTTFKVDDPNATAAQKKMTKEYLEESPPCFDFVKFFAKDTWRNIQKDFKEFSKEFEAFSKKHAASIESR